ncbi:hypothetical protein OESDEN_09369 [Oesophagostomum dentatum]|uniref:Uncharacterized protein n=1 Tax=Oesophagostomum dentatum TaxID=61180 RepID=A0A0B1T5V6_OESDE|nr:hypothetical protein OESDEN_09369 [Oesophagostomum dentatum]
MAVLLLLEIPDMYLVFYLKIKRLTECINTVLKQANPTSLVSMLLYAFAALVLLVDAAPWCVDEYPVEACFDMWYNDQCQTHPMRYKCRETCDLCVFTTAKPKPLCYDEYPVEACFDMWYMDQCQTHPQRNKCKKTCELC